MLFTTNYPISYHSNHQALTTFIYLFWSLSVTLSVSFSLDIIFQFSLETMSLPNIWKTANVSNIFKKGDRSDPSNYRPISLTCVACKIVESIIKHVVITYLLENNLLSNCQFGFVSGRSVQLQLLSLLNHWTGILDSGHTIDVIYLDFKKAFDSVPHIRLLSKVHSYGFRDPLLGWHKSFLIGRRQRVCVHDAVSVWHNFISAIPQGSVLGPVLFLLCINDLPDNVASNVYMLADDTKIYRPMTSHEDTTIQQDDPDCLQSWSAKWFLNFNLHKCKVMSITKSTACNHVNGD